MRPFQEKDLFEKNWYFQEISYLEFFNIIFVLAMLPILKTTVCEEYALFNKEVYF